MRPEERFTKTLFGTLLIVAFFIPDGKWLVLALGILFLVSAAWGICWSCKFSKLFGKPKVKIVRRTGKNKS